jgi:intracellular septation protein
MKETLWQLINDFLSAILFLIFYAALGDVAFAGGLIAIAGLAQLGWLSFAVRRIAPLRWVSLALTVALAGTTVLTQNPRFLMLKPSIVHLGVATAMLRRGWMTRYITPIARQNVSEMTMVAASYAWAALMAILGFTNLVIALDFDFPTWAWFISVGAVGAKLAAVVLQFIVFRMIVRRRLAQSVS